MIDNLEIPETLKVTTLSGPLYHDEELNKIIQVQNFSVKVDGEDELGVIDLLAESINTNIKNSTHLYFYSGCDIHFYKYEEKSSTNASIRYAIYNKLEEDLDKVI